MKKIEIIGLAFAGLFSMAMYSMADSVEQKLVDREMGSRNYLYLVEN